MSGPVSRDLDRLVGLVRAFRGKSAVVLGDLVVDEFVYGDITRVSREAPVLILDQTRTECVPGGGANSVANLRALGAAPIPVGVVGDDEAGTRLVATLRRMRVDTSRILRLRGYHTPCKSRILAGGVHTRRQQIVRVDRGSERGELPGTARRRLQTGLRSALREVDGLLLADYSYGAASPAVIEPLLPGIRRRGLPITVDSRRRVTQYHDVTACTPNQEELEQALDLADVEDDSLEISGKRLLRRTRNQAVLVTRGSRGMLLLERRRPARSIAAYGSDEVADVTGAGDTVIAVFTLALICGASFGEAAVLSNYAAGIVVTKAGTATTTRKELIGAVREDLSR